MFFLNTKGHTGVKKLFGTWLHITCCQSAMKTSIQCTSSYRKNIIGQFGNSVSNVLNVRCKDYFGHLYHWH